MRIACLHTAECNVAIFEAARPDGVSLRHAVRPDLLAAAEADGLTPDIAAATAEALAALRDGADAVLLTCSTLGPAAGASGADLSAGGAGGGAGVFAKLKNTGSSSARANRYKEGMWNADIPKRVKSYKTTGCI